MATASPAEGIEQIGETAGLVWQVLDSNGPMLITKLIKAVDAPRDQVMQAIGWLAREDKIMFTEEKRKKYVALI